MTCSTCVRVAGRSKNTADSVSPSNSVISHRSEELYSNVTVEMGNAAEGWARHGPYDAILLTGSVGRLSDELRRQLAPGGRLLAVVGRAPIMTAQLVTCTAPGTYRSEGLFETCIAPLKLAREPERFVF